MSAKEYNRNLANRRRKDSYCLLPHKGQDSNKTFKQFDCVFGSNKGGSIICSKFVYCICYSVLLLCTKVLLAQQILYIKSIPYGLAVVKIAEINGDTKCRGKRCDMSVKIMIYILSG